MVKRSGVDPEAAIEMLSSTLFPVPVYQSYGQLIAQNPEQLRTNWIGPKDVGLFRDVAGQVGSRTDLAELLLERLKTAKSL